MVVDTAMRRVRHALRISQVDLAAQVGISRRHLIRIESGERAVTRSVAAKIAKALETTPSKLFGKPTPSGRHLALMPKLGEAVEVAGDDDDDYGRLAYILTLTLRGNTEISFEIAEEIDRERIRQAFKEPQKTFKDRLPFLHIDIGRNLVFVNLNHVLTAELIQTLVDVPDLLPEASESEEKQPPQLSVPNQQGFILMAGGLKDIPSLLPNEDPTLAIQSRRALEVRTAYLREAQSWVPGGRISFISGGDMNSFLADETVVLDIPLNAYYVP